MSVGRKLSYDIEHYVEVVLNVLNTGQQWNTLQCPLHYSTYHKHFMNWVNTGIITELFTIATKMGHQISNKSTYYIDSAVIRNIKGVEDISYCYKIKSKRGTKLMREKQSFSRPTVLTNNLGMPLDIICSAANVHDINFVLPSCKNMKEKGIEMESLIGDKGYISEKIKTFLKDKYNIDYIFPYKKNTKSNTHATDKIALKERLCRRHKRLRQRRSRYINENAISWLTQHRRLTNRYAAEGAYTKKHFWDLHSLRLQM